MHKLGNLFEYGKKFLADCKIALDRSSAIGYNKKTLCRLMQESPSGMASASQADSGGFVAEHAEHRAAGAGTAVSVGNGNTTS